MYVLLYCIYVVQRKLYVGYVPYLLYGYLKLSYVRVRVEQGEYGTIPYGRERPTST